ncbi:MAG: response regulator transcription factor [Dehalococcoidia bacterium]|nr:response regulator transcription factor [Dehalococcoidia bacterium]
MLTLVVDDDEDYAALIEYTLKRGGHEVVKAFSAGAALSFSKRRAPDFAIVDVMLPDGSGFDLCRALKAGANDLGVVFLSTLDAPGDIVQGLEQGGDDYLTKPFHPNELLARVSAVARRTTGTANTARSIRRVEAAGISIDSSEPLVTFRGRDLKCTPTEAELLSELLSYPGEVLTYEYLTSRIWGYLNFQDSTLLKGHVSAVRQKLHEAGAPDRYIQTIHNVGYSFVADAQEA